MDTDTKACKDLYWEPRDKRIKVAPDVKPIYENAAFVSTVINGKAFKVRSKSKVRVRLGDT